MRLEVSIRIDRSYAASAYEIAAMTQEAVDKKVNHVQWAEQSSDVQIIMSTFMAAKIFYILPFSY